VLPMSRLPVVSMCENIDPVSCILDVSDPVAGSGESYFPNDESDVGIVLSEQHYCDTVAEMCELYVLSEGQRIVILLCY